MVTPLWLRTRRKHPRLWRLEDAAERRREETQRRVRRLLESLGAPPELLNS